MDRKKIMEQQRAAEIVTRTVQAVARKRQFHRLRLAVKAAETAYAVDFIRTLCPVEADLLQDPTLSPTIRFRFGGEAYPPQIMFKIYLSPSGTKVQYMSAKQLFNASSKAAEDALTLMGPKKYMEQVIEDWYLHTHSGGISDLMDISDQREYVQVMNALDKQPAYAGGRSNDWRPLHTLEPTTSSSTVNDFIEHAKSGGRTELKMITTELNATVLIDEQLAKLRAVAAHRALTRTQRGSQTSRLSRQERTRRMQQLRRAYGLAHTNTGSGVAKGKVLGTEQRGSAPQTPVGKAGTGLRLGTPTARGSVLSMRSSRPTTQQGHGQRERARRWSHSTADDRLGYTPDVDEAWAQGVAEGFDGDDGGEHVAEGFDGDDGGEHVAVEDEDAAANELFQWSQQLPVDVAGLGLDDDLLRSM